ncbi:MAG: TIGR00375 family protein [Candidatus Hadarchaeum sp.]|uniref:TIGR00375 family protein n=1 Tax=Candidatus Hadarchaeum sp. TaxID=2883567 RepID=UPI003D12766E
MAELRSYAADFHIHSKYSGATSSQMDVETIAAQARLKGLTFVGTGDVFHPSWFRSLKEELVEVAEGTFEHRRHGTRFILTVEVEDRNRVHHLIILPSFATAESVREELAKHSQDIGSDGRPRVELSGQELAEVVVAQDCLIGPAHAFTPWTSVYKEFDSLRDCYGDRLSAVSFVELGLSADSDMADRIAELADLTFLSNSDAHSPWPEKLGREFNRLGLAEPTYAEVVKAIRREDGRRVLLNVGFDPRLGKYHVTACSRCFKQFTMEEAVRLKWRCDDCRGWIKKGVMDRVNELADYPEPRHPLHRPGYLRIAPLAEVIGLATGEDPHSPGVKAEWEKLVTSFGDEISVLVDAVPELLLEVTSPEIVEVIKAFRTGTLRVIPGGGGRYGHLEIGVGVNRRPPKPQRKLTEFGI